MTSAVINIRKQSGLVKQFLPRESITYNIWPHRGVIQGNYKERKASGDRGLGAYGLASRNLILYRNICTFNQLLKLKNLWNFHT